MKSYRLASFVAAYGGYPIQTHGQTRASHDARGRNPGNITLSADDRESEQIARLLWSEQTIMPVAKPLGMTILTVQYWLTASDTS
jgi:hypothetical protein